MPAAFFAISRFASVLRTNRFFRHIIIADHLIDGFRSAMDADQLSVLIQHFQIGPQGHFRYRWEAFLKLRKVTLSRSLTNATISLRLCSITSFCSCSFHLIGVNPYYTRGIRS